MAVALVTDSSACVPLERAARHRLRTVPVVIHLPQGDLRDDAPAAPRLVYEALAREEPVKSSAPSVAEYLSAFEEVTRVADSVVAVTPAAEFTVMFRNASLAADLAGGEVRVVDSRAAAAAHGLVVLEAARAAAAGGSADEVVAVAEDAARRAELVAALDRLEHIRRSGRVPSVALGFAEHLGVKPVFRLRQGAVERLGVPRSVPAALRRIVREALVGGFAGARRAAVFHALAPDRAEALRRLLPGMPLVTEFSPSMGIHTGPGVVGVAWLRPA